MSTPYRGPDFDALAASDPDIAGVLAALGTTLSIKYAQSAAG